MIAGFPRLSVCQVLFYFFKFQVELPKIVGLSNFIDLSPTSPVSTQEFPRMSKTYFDTFESDTKGKYKIKIDGGIVKIYRDYLDYRDHCDYHDYCDYCDYRNYCDYLDYCDYRDYCDFH